MLSRAIGGLHTRATLRSLARMAARRPRHVRGDGRPLVGIDRSVPGTAKLAAVLRIVVLGALGAVVYLGLARLLRISEVTDVLATLRRRLPIGR